MSKISAADLKARAAKLGKKTGANKRLATFSHFVMAGVMMMFFVGVALGIYVTVFRDEPASASLDYIMKLAYVVSLGYFIKAFGENIAKIALSFIFGPRLPDSNNSDNEQGGAG
jgi:hypothetical protein